MAKRGLRLFFDGGCRPNPGKIEVAVIARRTVHLFDDLGCGTNNDAEWLALIAALKVAQSLGETGFDLVGDAELVIKQATGVWKCRSPALQAHCDTFAALAAHNPPRRIRWIRRAQNLAGIALAARHPR
jgi:ribonuclease HI